MQFELTNQVFSFFMELHVRLSLFDINVLDIRLFISNHTVWGLCWWDIGTPGNVSNFRLTF